MSLENISYAYGYGGAESVLSEYREALEENHQDIILLLEEVVLRTKLLERVLEGLE